MNFDKFVSSLNVSQKKRWSSFLGLSSSWWSRFLTIDHRWFVAQSAAAEEKKQAAAAEEVQAPDPAGIPDEADLP
jgi:hypothetical protein